GALLSSDAGTSRPRILEAGGFPGVLPALLARAGTWLPECEVSALETTPNAVDELDTHAFDYVVAVDWLSLVAPSRRPQQIAALCRAARSGVVLLNAFDAPE